MEAALKIARGMVKEGVKSVVWDTMSGFSEDLREECVKPDLDGRAGWEMYHRYLYNCVRRMLEIPAHIIVISHYEDNTPPDNKTYTTSANNPKVWTPGKEVGIVPLLYGKSRKIAKEFDDAVFMELDRTSNKRLFITSATGVYGVGCRSLKGVEVMDADIGKFIEARKQENGG